MKKMFVVPVTAVLDHMIPAEVMTFGQRILIDLGGKGKKSAS
jgi:hypothetical protein